MTTAIDDFAHTVRHRAFGSAQLNGFLEGNPDQQRPPLVLLHGLTFDHRMFLPALAVLRARDPGRQVLVLDLPGHGGSPMLAACDPEDVATALASAVEYAGLDQPVIVGHSMSAIVATIYAASYPTSGVVNVDCVIDTSMIEMLQANRDAMRGPGFPHVWQGLHASMQIDLLPEDAQRLLNEQLPRQDVVLGYWRQALDTPLPVMEARIAEVSSLIRARRVPYAIVAGHEYDAAYTRWLHELLPQATVTVIPHSGHFPHLADPAWFADLLVETGRWRAAARVA